MRVDIAMMRTPDGHGRLELTTFHAPQAVSGGPANAPGNTLGLRRRILVALAEELGQPRPPHSAREPHLGSDGEEAPSRR